MIDINLSKINKSFGTNKVLNDIDLTIDKGDRVALIGSNGCGKSTLLKTIIGEVSKISPVFLETIVVSFDIKTTSSNTIALNPYSVFHNCLLLFKSYAITPFP